MKGVLRRSREEAPCLSINIRRSDFFKLLHENQFWRNIEMIAEIVQGSFPKRVVSSVYKDRFQRKRKQLNIILDRLWERFLKNNLRIFPWQMEIDQKLNQEMKIS